MNVLVSRGMIRDVITALQYSEEAYLADKNTGIVSEVGDIVNRLMSRVKMASTRNAVHCLKYFKILFILSQ